TLVGEQRLHVGVAGDQPGIVAGGSPDPGHRLLPLKLPKDRGNLEEVRPIEGQGGQVRAPPPPLTLSRCAYLVAPSGCTPYPACRALVPGAAICQAARRRSVHRANGPKIPMVKSGETATNVVGTRT